MTNDSWVVPDACTLPSAAQPVRVAEFDALFATHLARVERLGSNKVRLVLRGGSELAAEVRNLADRETACCSFFTFTLVTPHDHRTGEPYLHLDVEVPQDRIDVLTALADRANATRTGASS